MESRSLKGTDGACGLTALGCLGWSGCGAVDLRFLSHLNPPGSPFLHSKIQMHGAPLVV